MPTILSLLALLLSLAGILALGQYGYSIGYFMLGFGFLLMLVAWLFSMPNEPFLY